MPDEDSAALAGRRSTAADIERLGAVARHPSIELAVSSARELLGMDIAYITEFDGSDQIFRVIDGDGASFGVGVDTVIPLADTYCQRLLDGRLSNPVTDTSAQPEAAALPITEAAGVGAYTSVPVVLGDGRFYGTLCCANHEVKIDLSDRDVQMLHVLARLTADQIERDELQREKQRLLAETAGVTALIAAVEARDSYTGEHSHSVVELATKVATGMGMRREALAEIQQVALLHDIGKLAIPDAVLNKPGPLSPDEWRAMREHPMIGGRIVSAIPELMHLGPAIRAEHERWDGRGYPDGLAGRAIPAASRIVFVCDAYHAMTSDRPYREALSNEAAIKEIFAGAGTQFCPETARELLKLLADEALA
jgi:HD-GYP domain-containing protein (c-di-GMP phosphodiesterase class II)